MVESTCAHCGETHPGTMGACPTLGVFAPEEKGVADLIGLSLDLYRRHAKTLIAVAAIVFIPGALANAFAQLIILSPRAGIGILVDPVTHAPVVSPAVVASLTDHFAVKMLELLAFAVTGVLFYGVTIPLCHGAMALTAADRLSGGTADWRAIWTMLFRRLGIVLSAVIPAALLSGIGFVFLLVPGLVLTFFFAFVTPVALFEGVGGLAALRRSWALVRSDWLRLLLLFMVFGIIMNAARILGAVVSGGWFGSQLIQDALTLVAMPIPVLGSVLLYFDVRRKAEGFSRAKLAGEMAQLYQTVPVR